MALWCILYIVIAVTFFPYDGPEESDLLPDPSHQEETESPLNQPVRLPLAVDPLQERSVEQRQVTPTLPYILPYQGGRPGRSCDQFPTSA